MEAGLSLLEDGHIVNNNNKKKIYNAHIVMTHESEARAVARWPDGVC